MSTRDNKKIQGTAWRVKCRFTKELNTFKSVTDLTLEGRGGVYSDYTLFPKGLLISPILKY